MPEIMVALDLNYYWSSAPYEFIDRLKRAGCTHYKVHDPLPGMDLRATVAHLRKAVLPGKTAVIMYDNKEHDIPSRTVRAVENHLMMGFDLVTVHTLGTRDMLEHLAKAGLGKHCVAVTVLTSAREEGLVEIYGKGRATLEPLLAGLAFDCGMGGLVCGAPDIPSLPERTRALPLMTPGIYLPGQQKPEDQRAAATPREALDLGSSHLILGRSIVGSKHPEKVFADIKAQIELAT